jgi:hypothetical protein
MLNDISRSVGPALAAGPRFARQMVRRSSVAKASAVAEAMADRMEDKLSGDPTSDCMDTDKIIGSARAGFCCPAKLIQIFRL